jgi:hypothetical protein
VRRIGVSCQIRLRHDRKLIAPFATLAARGDGRSPGKVMPVELTHRVGSIPVDVEVSPG